MSQEPIRVVVRGAAGLLGSRICAAMQRCAGIVLTGAIFKRDATLERAISLGRFGGRGSRALFDCLCFLDEPDEVSRELNREVDGLRFLSIRELDLPSLAEVVIDATQDKSHTAQHIYASFKGPIIFQDGIYPVGRLIAAPIRAPDTGGQRYRQGGCLLSGLSPIINAFRNLVSRVRISVVMQYDGRERDYMIAERANSIRFVPEHAVRLEEELSLLFPEQSIRVSEVIQVPSLVHYLVSLECVVGDCSSEVGVLSEVRRLLASTPRIGMIPRGVSDTSELSLARVLDSELKPIHMFERGLECVRARGESVICCKLALYYRTLAVLPNLDAVRMVCGGMEGLEAMAHTDRDMGF